MLLTDLAIVVRKSSLPVVEVEGWQNRGHGQMVAVKTIVCHHTAGPATGNYPSLNIVRSGRSDLPGPLAQLGLGRDGTVYVIAAGLSYHAGVVRESDYGNAYAIGIEAEATGVDPWPPAQLGAYVRLCRALCDHYDLSPDRVLGHKEVCSPPGRKTDPNFDMAVFRHMVQEDDTLNADDKQWLENLIDAKLKANNPTLVKAIWDASITKASAAGVAARAALRKAAGL